jgi:hypothetical protein
MKAVTIEERNGTYCLIVEGRKLGEIGELGECATNGAVPFTWLEMANRIENDPLSDSDREAENAKKIREDAKGKGPRGLFGVPHIPEAFWRTLVGNRPKRIDTARLLRGIS